MRYSGILTIALATLVVTAETRAESPQVVGRRPATTGGRVGGCGIYGGALWGGGFFGPVGYPGFGVYSSRNMTPPYFSVYPPVYYGDRVRLRYGYSPFATSPFYIRQNLNSGYAAAAARPARVRPAPEPQLVGNPYVKGGEQQVEAAQPVSQWVDNPYFVPPHKSSRDQLVNVTK